MSQSRFWISTHPTYELAATAKKNALNDNPEGVYQVRRGTDKDREVFRLVQRFKNNEARIVKESKRRSKRANKRRTEDFSWVSGKA